MVIGWNQCGMGSGSELVASFMKLVFHASPSGPDTQLASGTQLAVPCFVHLLPSAVFLFLFNFPGFFFSGAQRKFRVFFTSLQLHRSYITYNEQH